MLLMITCAAASRADNIGHNDNYFMGTIDDVKFYDRCVLYCPGHHTAQPTRWLAVRSDYPAVAGIAVVEWHLRGGG